MLPAAHFWSLTAIAAAAGAAMLWVFRRFSDQAAVALAKRRLWAYLYAFRLFGDEPSLIFRAQKQLLIWNGRYLALMLRPAAVMILPTLLLLTGLDAIYGHRPLAAGESTVVTAQFRSGSDVDGVAASLEGHGIAVETPPVRIPEERQVCWRVRVTGAGDGSVVLRASGTVIRKTLQSGSGIRFIPERRVSSPFTWLRYPGESLFADSPVSWIGIAYPPARIAVFSFEVHWLVWFLAVSLLVALALGKALGIRF